MSKNKTKRFYNTEVDRFRVSLVVLVINIIKSFPKQLNNPIHAK